jgi:hypothetical protein
VVIWGRKKTESRFDFSDTFVLQSICLAYQAPANSTFLSQQINHQQPASSIFLSEQTRTRETNSTLGRCESFQRPLGPRRPFPILPARCALLFPFSTAAACPHPSRK